jgi:DNA-binding FadR family transcriptional regulator
MRSEALPAAGASAAAPLQSDANADDEEGASLAGQPRQAKVRVADRVFEALLGAILRGELEPGEPLPTQRTLSREFGVSPLVVRQAIHRLEELELVRVRQGSPTIVLDPNQAADVRLIQLQLEAATPGDAFALAGVENGALSSLPLLVLAARRIEDAELAALDALVEGLGENPSAGVFETFQAAYWLQIAAATRNPLMQHQVRWWFHTLPGLKLPSVLNAEPKPRSIYQQVNDSLRRRTDVLDSWLGLLSQLFDWTETQPGHATHQSPTAQDRGRSRFPRTRTRFAMVRVSSAATASAPDESE